MKLFNYVKNNKEFEIDLCFQITSWMGQLVLPGGIRWWTPEMILGGYSFMFDIDILCFTLHFEYWNFGRK